MGALRGEGGVGSGGWWGRWWSERWEMRGSGVGEGNRKGRWGAVKYCVCVRTARRWKLPFRNILTDD